MLPYINCGILTILHTLPFSPLQMYSKVTSEKKSFGLQKTAEKAKTLVQVGGLSEASAEGKPRPHHTCTAFVWSLCPYLVNMEVNEACLCVYLCLESLLML